MSPLYHFGNETNPSEYDFRSVSFSLLLLRCRSLLNVNKNNVKQLVAMKLIFSTELCVCNILRLIAAHGTCVKMDESSYQLLICDLETMRNEMLPNAKGKIVNEFEYRHYFATECDR